MRNLTIERRKKFAGSAVPVKFYIEDAEHEELRIEDTPCRKLGQLKNGETKTFSISNDSAKLFSIYDKLSKEYCNDFYQLPTSSEDIYLSGEAKVSPGIGNTFIFDGNPLPPMTKKKKRGRIIGWVVLAVAIIIGSVVGNIFGGWIGKGLFSDTGNLASAQPKNFTAPGIQITLNEDFAPEDVDNFTACFSSKDAAVFVLQESFSLLPGSENYTLEEYGQLVLQNNGMTDFELQTVDGIMFFEYEADNEEAGGTIYYFVTLHKGIDAFWLVEFACDVDEAEDYLPYFLDWAKSVSFSA